MTVLVDTGPLVALLSRKDHAHPICVEVFKALKPPLLTTWPVLTEVAWLLRHEPKILQQFLLSIDAGWLRVDPLQDGANRWIARFMSRFESLGVQLADASLVYLAERDQIDTVFTLDRRDFSIYRFGNNQSFKLLPEVF